MNSLTPSRRSFLKTSAAIGASAFVFPFATQAFPQGKGESFVSNFLRIDRDGGIVIVTPVAEVGQGTSTALPMILAEALDADWTKVRFELASVGKEYGNPTLGGMQLTGASTGVSAFHDPLQNAGAVARTMLILAAAKIWNVSPEACSTQNGRVLLGKTKKILTYGELASAAAEQPVPKVVAPLASSKNRFVGNPIPRLDIPGKVDGSATFAVDVRLPGMLYATVAACPTFGGELLRDTRPEVLKQKGVRGVVDLPGAVAVVADRWWIARRALDSLKAEWAPSQNDQVNDESISTQLWGDLQSKVGVVVKTAGTPDAALLTSQTVVTAQYEVPFLAHATMEPMSCVARVNSASCDVWVGSQLPDKARAVAAEVAGLSETSVTIHTLIAGGGFGRRQEADFVAQAVLVAKNFPGQPVKLIWSREEDIQHDFYRPAGVSELTAGVTGKDVLVFKHKQASQTILPRMYPAFMQAFDSVVTDAIFALYDFPNQEARWVRSETHVPAGMWRSVGASQTVFAIESFIDEIAAKTGEDPYQFRRDRLRANAKALRVLDRLAEISGYNLHAGGTRAIGLGISHKNLDCLVAQAAEVSLESGRVVVHRIWTVADPGQIINPDTAKAQLEGAAIWGLSAALYGKISIGQGRVQESNFDTYQVVRLADTPTFVTELLLSGGPFEGIGEGGAPNVAPAVCNALFRLTGKRIRRLPIAKQFA